MFFVSDAHIGSSNKLIDFDSKCKRASPAKQAGSDEMNESTDNNNPTCFAARTSPPATAVGGTPCSTCCVRKMSFSASARRRGCVRARWACRT